MINTCQALRKAVVLAAFCALPLLGTAQGPPTFDDEDIDNTSNPPTFDDEEIDDDGNPPTFDDEEIGLPIDDYLFPLAIGGLALGGYCIARKRRLGGINN